MTRCRLLPHSHSTPRRALPVSAHLHSAQDTQLLTFAPFHQEQPSTHFTERSEAQEQQLCDLPKAPAAMGRASVGLGARPMAALHGAGVGGLMPLYTGSL